MRNLALEPLSWHEALIQLLRHTVMFVITKAVVGDIVVAAADMASHVAYRRPHPNRERALTEYNMKHAAQTTRMSVLSCSTLAMSHTCYALSYYYLYERQKVGHTSAPAALSPSAPSQHLRTITFKTVLQYSKRAHTQRNMLMLLFKTPVSNAWDKECNHPQVSFHIPTHKVLRTYSMLVRALCCCRHPSASSHTISSERKDRILEGALLSK